MLTSVSCFSSNGSTVNALHESAQKRISITSGIYIKSYEKYEHHLAGDICEELNLNFDKEQIDRFLVDILITCMAFKQVGIKLDITLFSFPNNKRAKSMVELGKLDTLTTSIWSSDINQERLHSSAAVVRKGEFQKGIYVLDSHPLLSTPIDEIDFSKYIAVTSKNWLYDWQILNELTPNVQALGYLPSLVPIIKSGRADFIINAFPSDLSFDYTRQGTTLKAIKGLKVIIPDSRHFIATTKSQRALEYIKALNKGLTKLRQQGLIEKTYQASGFFNKKTKDWKVLNP